MPGTARAASNRTWPKTSGVSTVTLTGKWAHHMLWQAAPKANVRNALAPQGRSAWAVVPQPRSAPNSRRPNGYLCTPASRLSSCRMQFLKYGGFLRHREESQVSRNAWSSKSSSLARQRCSKHQTGINYFPETQIMQGEHQYIATPAIQREEPGLYQRGLRHGRHVMCAIRTLTSAPSIHSITACFPAS